MTIPTLHVLLVEDSRSDAHLIRALLRKSKLQPFDLECAGDLASALRRLKAGEFDAVLLDLSLPDSEGIETFTKAHAEAHEVPIVILTGLDDEETAVQAVGAGAQDYLVKGQVQGPLLVRALRYAVERKRAADEIRRLNAELERQVRERTAEFEAANRELADFCYSVSHDLRAPLRAINGFGALLLKDYAGQFDARGQHYLQRMRESATAMAQLIDDLLSLARLARAEMRWQEVDLSALAQAAAAELRATHPSRSVEFVIAPGVRGRGDAHLLRVVLDNLLGNAWKYASKHATARIEFGCTEMDGQPVYFVRDDGAGFEMAYTNKLFGAFQRLHSTEEFEGTGIGLATVQRVIQRHGGRVWAEGAVEQGATFYFTLSTPLIAGNSPVRASSAGEQMKAWKTE